MGEMKVEHVLLFLVGAFLVYHMMGKCRRVEGVAINPNDCIMEPGDPPCCVGLDKSSFFGSPCYDVKTADNCRNTYDAGENPFSDKGKQCQWKEGSCHPGHTCHLL